MMYIIIETPSFIILLLIRTLLRLIIVDEDRGFREISLRYRRDRRLKTTTS